jgi:hypothetical protein
MRRCKSGTTWNEDAGLTGLQELAVAISIAALLSVGGMFTYRVLMSGAGDRAVQSTLDAVLAAAHSEYEETQDYGLIGSAQPTAALGGACDGHTGAASLLDSYATGVAVLCGTQTVADPGSVVIASGELTNGDSGGWVGIAALARDGRCWQVYQPGDGAAVYGPGGTEACRAPVVPPPGGGLAW